MHIWCTEERWVLCVEVDRREWAPMVFPLHQGACHGAMRAHCSICQPLIRPHFLHTITYFELGSCSLPWSEAEGGEQGFGGLTEESEHTRRFPIMRAPCWELRVLTLSLSAIHHAHLSSIWIQANQPNTRTRRSMVMNLFPSLLFKCYIYTLVMFELIDSWFFFSAICKATNSPGHIHGLRCDFQRLGFMFLFSSRLS
jgi:hypothetical protein